MRSLSCPNCSYTRTWKLRRKKRKCKRCRSEFSEETYPVLGFRVTREEWQMCIKAFLRERTIRRVVEETRKSHCLIERMLMHIRERMAEPTNETFMGPLEMDETYIGGQRKNKRLHIRRIKGKKGHGTDKLPIFGIFDRHSRKVLVAVEPNKLDLQFIIRTLKEHALPGATVYTDGFKMYRQLSQQGFRHEYVDHDADELVRGPVHTNNMEGFWGILKRKLGCIGGMRRKYLHLFVAEIVWRFNHRSCSMEQQGRMLLNLIFHY